MQAADPGLNSDEAQRLRNRALARWLITAGPAPPRPGGQPVKAELVVRDGRMCAAVTAADGQILALYPVSGSGEHRRLYKAVPVPASRPLPPARSPISSADFAAMLARSRASREAAALLCARSRDLCESSSSQNPRRVALSPPVYPGDHPCPGKGAAIQSHNDEDQSTFQRATLGVRQERYGQAELH